MRKAIILSIILLAGVTAMAVRYFSEITGKSANLSRVLSYIPADAALVLNFSNDESLYEIFKDYEVFDAIIGERRAREIQQLKELLFTHPDIADATAEKQIFLSFHPRKDDSVDFLFSINIGEKISSAEILELLQQAEKITVKETGEDNLLEVTSGNELPFHVHFDKGVALVSFSKRLIEECRNKTISKLDEDFVREINETSKKNQNSPVNLFINHSALSNFISKFTKGKANGNLALLSKLHGISSLNMNFKSDALMFSGLSTVDTSKFNYFNLFLKQKPVKNELKNLLPADLSNFLIFGFSDYAIFKKDLDRYLESKKELKKLQDQIAYIKNKTGVDFDKDIKPLWSNEFSLVENKYRERFAIIKLKNGRNLNFNFQFISTSFGDNISQLNFSNVFYYYFGDPFKNFPRPFYAIIDNYLIISNTPGIIQKYLKDYENQRFLHLTSEFMEFNQLVANQSNLFYFINNQNSEKVFRANLKNSYFNTLSDKSFGYKNIYGLSYQWSSDGDHFFTNLYLNYAKRDTAHADSTALVQ